MTVAIAATTNKNSFRSGPVLHLLSFQQLSSVVGGTVAATQPGQGSKRTPIDAVALIQRWAALCSIGRARGRWMVRRTSLTRAMLLGQTPRRSRLFVEVRLA